MQYIYDRLFNGVGNRMNRRNAIERETLDMLTSIIQPPYREQYEEQKRERLSKPIKRFSNMGLAGCHQCQAELDDYVHSRDEGVYHCSEACADAYELRLLEWLLAKAEEAEKEYAEHVKKLDRSADAMLMAIPGYNTYAGVDRVTPADPNNPADPEMTITFKSDFRK